MAKSKNHTAHNQTRKAHRNGIKRPKSYLHTSTKGMNPKYLRNLKYARKYQKLGREKHTAMLKEARVKRLASWGVVIKPKAKVAKSAKTVKKTTAAKPAKK